LAKLFTFSRGTCAGHACDLCQICVAGRCCRGDVPDYRLPSIGEWEGPIYGELGKLSGSDDLVECHACGEEYMRIGHHAWFAHDLTPDEYRAIFGLKKTQGLMSRSLSKKFSDRLRIVMADPDNSRRQDTLLRLAEYRFTPERIAYVNTIRPRSYQERLEFGDRRRGIVTAGRAVQPQPCVICGSPGRVVNSKARMTCSPSCHEQLRAANWLRTRNRRRVCQALDGGRVRG
jgi:hypothetical protein